MGNVLHQHMTQFNLRVSAGKKTIQNLLRLRAEKRSLVLMVIQTLSVRQNALKLLSIVKHIHIRKRLLIAKAQNAISIRQLQKSLLTLMNWCLKIFGHAVSL